MTLDMLREVGKGLMAAQPDGDERAKQLGAVIHRARTQLGISKAEAARRAQVATSTWQLLEAGDTANPTDSTLGRIAKVLELDPGDLLRILGRPVETTLSALVQRISSAAALSEDDAYYLAVENHSRLSPAAKRLLIDAFRLSLEVPR